MTNTPLIISNISIHHDAEGRYSLNDLHKAAGKEHRHLPNYWLELQQTKELIEEILNTGITVFKNGDETTSVKPVDTKKGRYGGTYVCKELVYSYAMWISAAFSLKVIRAYDALVSGNKEQAEQIARTTVDERTPLRDAVNMLVGKRHLMYPEAYAMVHQRFSVDTIEELKPEQIPQAIEYVHKLAIEGEFLGRQEALPAPTLEINYPADWFLNLSMMARITNNDRNSFHLSTDMLIDCPSPSCSIFQALREHGYDVAAAEMEISALRHIMMDMRSVLAGIAMKAEKNRHSGLTFRL